MDLTVAYLLSHPRVLKKNPKKGLMRMLSFTIFGPVQSFVHHDDQQHYWFHEQQLTPFLRVLVWRSQLSNLCLWGIWNQNAIPTVPSRLDNTHVLTIAYVCRRAPFILLCVARQGQDMTFAQQRSYPYFVIWELVKAPLSPGMGTGWREAFFSLLHCMYTYFSFDFHPKEL